LREEGALRGKKDRSSSDRTNKVGGGGGLTVVAFKAVTMETASVCLRESLNSSGGSSRRADDSEGEKGGKDGGEGGKDHFDVRWKVGEVKVKESEGGRDAVGTCSCWEGESRATFVRIL